MYFEYTLIIFFIHLFIVFDFVSWRDIVEKVIWTTERKSGNTYVIVNVWVGVFMRIAHHINFIICYYKIKSCRILISIQLFYTSIIVIIIQITTENFLLSSVCGIVIKFIWFVESSHHIDQLGQSQWLTFRWKRKSSLKAVCFLHPNELNQ